MEDHPVYRDGLIAAFGEASDIEVAGAVGTVADTLRLFSGEPIDVLLLDLGLPDGSGLDLLATLRARHSRVAVVVLTMNEDRQMVLDVVRAGARGYLLKARAARKSSTPCAAQPQGARCSRPGPLTSFSPRR